MSLEQQIEALTIALTANTAALAAMGNVPALLQPQNPAAAPTVIATTTAPTLGVVPAATQALAPTAAAPVTPLAAAIPAAASPSSPALAPAAALAPVAMTLEQLKQEVTAIYQARNSDPQVMAIVLQYAPSLTEIPVEQYGNVIAALRALP